MPKLAIPLFGGQVAPRFCYADEFLVVGHDCREITSTARVSLAHLSGAERLATLARMGVKALVCGGINRHFFPLAKGLGIRVEWGLAGEAEALAEAYCCGDIERFRLGRGDADPGEERRKSDVARFDTT